MSKKFLIIVMSLIMVASTSMVAFAWGWGGPLIKPGDHVYDAARDQQWTLAQAEFVTQVANMVIEIENQIKNLTSMAQKALSASTNIINQRFDQLKSIINSAEGTMKIGQSVNQIQQNYLSVDYKKMSLNENQDDRLNYYKNILDGLDKTYLDSLRVAKLSEQVESENKSINMALEESKNATGNKAAKQSEGIISATNTELKMKINQVLSSLTASTSMQNQYQKTIEEEARMNGRQHLRAGAADPYNPTEDDKKNFKQPPGRGFIHFN